MKLSIVTTLAILALAAWQGFRDEKRIAAARERNAHLAEDTRRAGIQLNSTYPARITKRHREDRSVDVTVLTNGLLALFGKDEASRSHEEMRTLGEMIESLDPAKFRELFSRLRESNPMELKSRDDSLRMVIQRFSDLFPQATLEFLAESPDVLQTGNPGKINAIHIAINGWAAVAPNAALAWFRENKDKSADFSGEEIQGFLLSGIARSDPKMAFGLLAAAGFAKEKADSIFRWAAPENRQQALEGLRDYSQGLSDPMAREQTMEQGLKTLSSILSQQDFEISQKWMESAELNQKEREIIAKNLTGYAFQPADTGRWIEWIAGALTAGEADPKIAGLVSQWTQIDYQAAGKWLVATPDGPAKNAAIRSYAETVAKYEPEAAAQWALTMPAGKDRDLTLRQIYQNWPGDDITAKEAFKQEHGIK